MQKTSVTSWAFLKEMFGPSETVGIMAYEAKHQVHKATVLPQQLVQTRAVAVSTTFTKKLQYLNAKGLNIVVCTNPLLDGAEKRHKDTVKEVRHLVADIDTRADKTLGRDVTGKELLDSMLADPQCPKPYFILNTSPDNYQVVWRVGGFSREQAEATQKAIGAYYGGDRNISTDLSRGIRLPGLHNKKYDQTYPVSCDLHAKVTHRPEAFAYLPQPHIEDTLRSTPTQILSPNMTVAQHAMDAPDRGPKLREANSSPYQSNGPDHSGSGVDWAQANRQIATELRKQGASRFDSIVETQRSFLENAGRERGKPSPRSYATKTIEKLRLHWAPRLHEYAFQTEQKQSNTTGTGNTATPAVPASRSSAGAPAVLAVPIEDKPRPEIPASGFPPEVVAAKAEIPTYKPTPEQRSHDAFCVKQDLREGQTPSQIYKNMLEWKMQATPGAEVYLTGLIVEQQRLLRAESLLPSVQTVLRDHLPELEAYRQVLNLQVPGDGVLSISVMALTQAEKLAGSPLYESEAGSPSNNAAARDHAFRLATLAFTHGDSVSGVEQALTSKYHPNLPADATPLYLSQIVNQAQAAQAIAFTSQDREHVR